MKNWKKYASLLLALVLCLGLAACADGGGGGGGDIGGLADDDWRTTDLADDDWRTTGVVDDSGTITRGAEEIRVLLCVREENTFLYYDTKEEAEFGVLDYPSDVYIWNTWDKYRGIDFSDLNGDGDGDAKLELDDDGRKTVMVWFWDSQSDRFVFQPELSEFSVPVLTSKAPPFDDMEPLQSDKHDNGTYYYVSSAMDGQITVVNTVKPSCFVYDVQTLDDYLSACALGLGGGTSDGLTIEENEAYSEAMSYPVYVATYTAGGNEDAQEWIVFAMDTDSYTYLYGLSATLDAAEDMESIYQDIFAGLYLSDGE